MQQPRVHQLEGQLPLEPRTGGTFPLMDLSKKGEFTFHTAGRHTIGLHLARWDCCGQEVVEHAIIGAMHATTVARILDQSNLQNMGSL